MAVRGVRAALAVILAVSVALVGCAAPRPEGALAMRRTPAPSAVPTTPVPPTPTPSPYRSLRPRATLNSTGSAGTDGGRSSGTNDGVPAVGSGTFEVAPGGTDVVGGGATLVTYRVEVEAGIPWGANHVWTPEGFAAAADGVLADPRGWILSAQHPVTDAAQHMSGASWSFQRVSGPDYSVRILLATPGTVDKMCGSIGLYTNGQLSCRYGKIILINLRRWLNGAPGFPMDLDGYHTMVINHEMGHRLGFNHMRCPAAGTLAPIMMQETIDIGGCLPNAYPYAPDGTFLDGPYAA